MSTGIKIILTELQDDLSKMTSAVQSTCCNQSATGLLFRDLTNCFVAREKKWICALNELIQSVPGTKVEESTLANDSSVLLTKEPENRALAAQKEQFQRKLQSLQTRSKKYEQIIGQYISRFKTMEADMLDLQDENSELQEKLAFLENRLDTMSGRELL